MKKATLTFCSIAFAFVVVALGCQPASTTVADNKPAPNALKANTTVPASPAPEDDAARITLADAKAVFDSGGAMFVDTRASSAYEAERIKGAVNIPMDKLPEKIKDLPKDKKIIAYCS